MKLHSSRRVCCLLLILFLGSGLLLGQTATTTVLGQITDQQGAAIVGAKITLTNLGTGIMREEVSDSSGMYQVSSLAPGKYSVRVEMSGFRTASQESVELLVNTSTRLNFTLQVGAPTETVEGSAAAEKLNTTDASVGNAFNENQIRQLPLEGRNVVGLLSLQPGAVYVPTTYIDNRQGSISGSRGDQTNVTMDGVDVNDPNGLAYNSVLRATLDSTQEFRVTTTNYGADQGRSSAAQVSLVTKSGTNAFHGSGYWYHRNTVFSSNEYFNKNSQLWNVSPVNPNAIAQNPECKPGETQCQPLLQKHIWGWSFGGPVWKDRFFFFANMENLRQKSQSSEERNVPSNSFRDGVLIYECSDPAQCPAATVNGLHSTHSVPAGYYGLTPAELAGIDPLGIGPSIAVSDYFSQFPSPNAQGRDGFNFAGYRFAAPIKNMQYTYISRLDFKIDPNGNHQLTWRGNLQDDSFNAAPQWPGKPPASMTLNNNRGMMAGYTAVLSPRVVNTFRYGFTRIGGGTSGQLVGPWSSLRFFTDYIPQTSTRVRIVPTHNFVDDISWNRGAHTFQFGANFRFTRVITSTNANSWPWATANGSWMAGNGATYLPGTDCPVATTDPNQNIDTNCLALPLVSDGGISSFADGFTDILGALSQSNTTYNYDKTGRLIPYGEVIKRKYATNAWEYYGQDNWRIKPNLNIVFGLRYSLNSPPWEVNGEQVAPTVNMGEWFIARMRRMQAGIPENATPLVSFDLAGRANHAAALYKYDKNNLAPRIAFSYSPNFNEGFLKKLTGGTGKTVIRGGYSMVYDNMGLALANQIDQVASFGMATNVSSPYQQFTEQADVIRYQNPTYVPDTYPAAQPGGFPATPGTFRGAIDEGIDNSLVTPYAQMYNFMIGRELPGNMTVDVGYVGRRGRALSVRRDLAMPSNLVDKGSGVDYFTAARQIYQYASGLPRSAPYSAYATLTGSVPYFENLFPGAAGTYCDGYGPWTSEAIDGPCDTALTTLTASQAMGRFFRRAGATGDWTAALYNADEYCWPACSKFGQFAFFNPQWDALGVLSTVGVSEYHALQTSLRKRYSNGVDFTLNYTFSKSNDTASAVERGDFWTEYFPGGYTGILINSFDPRSTWSPSDFDVRHQINLNWTIDLPFGQRKALAGNAPGWLNAFIGGWQWNGIYRWSSGFPFSIIDCRSCWPTNWQVQGNAIPIDPNNLPPTGHYQHVVGDITQGALLPSMFKDPQQAYQDYFRLSYPGEGGVRNYLRGDGYFTVDVGLGKTWSMPWKESHKLKFRWEVFNLTNSARFDVSSLNMLPDDMNTFGSYASGFSGCDNAAGRCMQGSLRFEF